MTPADTRPSPDALLTQAARAGRGQLKVFLGAAPGVGKTRAMLDDGHRHEKRWQDVEDVLAAGIDVCTTLNIQHIETLNETVARITGVRVRETVPDRVLAMADEIELIDIPPDELVDRLKQGKVYPQDQAARALTSFFGKGNLTALRELAMRTAADRVDAQLREHMAANAIPGPWPTQERILVCINESPAAREAIRVAKRSADRARAEWIALNVSSTRSESMPDADKDRLAATLRLAERLGAELATPEADRDMADAILAYAADRNVAHIVIGRPRARQIWARLMSEDVAAGLLRRSGRFEVTIATESDDTPRTRALHLPRPDTDPCAMAEAVAAVAVASLCAFAAERLFPVASVSVIYMTAVVVVDSRRGLFPAILAAVLGFLAYNFLFTHPRYSFRVSRQGELLTLFLFLAASLITGNLAARLRARVEAQSAIADRTNKLYDFSRRVAAAATADDVIWASVSHVATTLRCETIPLMPQGAELQVVGGFPPEDRLDVHDQSAAQFAWDRGETAGRGSDTPPTARWVFLPLATGDRKLGILGIAFDDDRTLARTDRRLLDALTDQIALALERLRLTQELSATAREAPALVILDLGLPDADGITVVREIRGWSVVPVLILSVRSDEAGKVAALDAGAQDYVVKPFGMKELLARVRTLLRDRGGSVAPSMVQIGDPTIDAARHSVTRSGEPLHLTRKEFDLLWMPAANRGRLLTPAMILKTIWGPAHAEDAQHLRVYIRQLRQKLGDDAADPRWIFTEPGVGYRLADK